MNAIVFDIASCVIAIGAALLAKRQFIIIWTLALHICIANVTAILLVISGLMNSFGPGYYIMNMLFAFTANMVLYHYRNHQTLYPYLAFLAFSIMCYLVFFERFIGSSIFHPSWPFVMSLIITIQIVLIANIGGSIGTIRRYWQVSRHSSVSYGHSHYRVDKTVISWFQRNAEGDR